MIYEPACSCSRCQYEERTIRMCEVAAGRPCDSHDARRTAATGANGRHDSALSPALIGRASAGHAGTMRPLMSAGEQGRPRRS